MSVTDYSAWATRTARGLMGSEFNRAKALDFEDLAQVGLIAAWQAESTFTPGAGQLPHWRTMKGRGAMLDALRGRDKDRMHAAAAPIAAAHDTPSNQDVHRAAELAELRAAVAAALATLTAREQDYVRRRFWDQWTTSDFIASPEWGYDPRGVWRGARTKLATLLGPVQELMHA